MAPIVLGLWSVVLEPGKTLSQNISVGIQITNVSFGETVTGKERSVVSIKYPEFEQDSDAEDEEEEDDDEEEDEDNIKLPKLITKQCAIAVLKPDVTESASVNVSLVEDVEVVEFSVTGPNAVHLVGHYIRQEEFDEPPYSDDEFDSDDDDEEIDSDEAEALGLIGGDSEDEDDDIEVDEERFEEVKENPKKRVAEEEVVAAAKPDGEELSKNQKKKLAKKLKAADGSAAPAPAEKKAEEKKVEKKEAPKSQTLAGGLVITDAKKGDGPVAKSGKKVSMRYIGKLDSGKIFDSNTKGSPLTFTLGRGEVIKGWDQGIVGMAVGGERKLTIPAALAYGKKGTQGIPGNSTLHFDVKLIAIKDLGDIPVVTKTYLIAAVGVSVAVQCNLINPLQLYFTYRIAFEQGQIYRVVTTFLFWGHLSVDFLFHLFFFMRYSRMLEESTFHGRRADYVWLLIILSPLSPSPFLSSPLSFTLVYLWSRLNPTVRLSLFGIITITAPYLPFALCLFSWALSSSGGGKGWGLGVIMGDALGLLAGHWWYFWTEVWKRERGSGGRNWLETPRILVKLLDSPERLRELDETAARENAQAALAVR
ncbi:hypothetical protein MNV49_004888 [Pseudohyphozyma bogoriensis]|nr:hypothetical protein MNV49_004888 [Pseudohyphozyma bogoriensis]